MKQELINLLDKTNKLMNGNLINLDSNEYVEKLLNMAVINSYIIEGKLIGFCAYYMNDLTTKTSFLSMICVEPGYQRNGIGLLLMTQWIISAKYNGYKTFRLEVDMHNNRAAKFYEKMGFKECKKMKHSLIMECDLKDLNIRLS